MNIHFEDQNFEEKMPFFHDISVGIFFHAEHKSSLDNKTLKNQKM